jgi:hypothetical protein
MWSDMFFRLGGNGEYYVPEANIPNEVKKMVPENVSQCYWDYYHYEKEVYDAMFKAHEGFDGEIWFAGGAWCWSGFAPNNGKSLITSRSAMQSVREHGVKHVLITMWGDNGRECSPFALLPSLYATKQYAEGNFDDVKIKEDFYKLFGVQFDDFTLLDLPNKIKPTDETPTGNPCKALLYCDAFMGILDKLVEETPSIPYAEYAKTLSATAERMGEFKYMFDVSAKLCEILAIKAELGVKTRKAYQNGDKTSLSALVNEYYALVPLLDEFHKIFYKLWHTDNKPQGWEVQDARLGGLSRRIQTCAQRLGAYKNGELETIPELEEEVLPYFYDTLYSNTYSDLISRNIV